MNKSISILFCLILACGVAFAQNHDKKLSNKKLTKEEAAKLTTEQRLARETDRKTKGGKRKMSTAKKAKIERKQARSAEHTRQPKHTERAKPKN